MKIKRLYVLAAIITLVAIFLIALIRPVWLSKSEKLFQGNVVLEEVFVSQDGPYGFGGEGDWFQVYRVTGLDNLKSQNIDEVLKGRPLWSTLKPSGWKRFKWKAISSVDGDESQAIHSLSGYQTIRSDDPKDMATMKQLLIDVLHESGTRVSGQFRDHEMMMYVYSPSRKLLFYFARIT